MVLPDNSGSMPVSASLKEVISNADVVVDFSNADGALSVIRTASANKVNVVIGSTGLNDDQVKEAESLAQENQICIIIAPNFAVGAVLMTYVAGLVSRFFDYADLTEMHHEAKIDAPSGTALSIARSVINGKNGEFISPKAEKELVSGTRGGTLDGVSIHSVRMPGLVAHHELVFGANGQTLTVRHDSINRESFMPGVVLAVRRAIGHPGLIVGLDQIMGL
jgi:4-hydroxy-tetrahydrodipicolinate reductase